MAEEGYRGPQVCSIVGITYRQLDYWARTNLLRPSIADAKGSGSQRRYSYNDLLELKVIKSLLDAGVSLRSARTAIEYLRAHVEGDVASANLVLNGSRSVLVRTGEEIVDLLRNGQGVLNIVPLAGVKDEVDAGILELRPTPIEASPIEASPIEASPVEASPIEASPVEASPVEASPIEASPIEASDEQGPAAAAR